MSRPTTLFLVALIAVPVALAGDLALDPVSTAPADPAGCAWKDAHAVVASPVTPDTPLTGPVVPTGHGAVSPCPGIRPGGALVLRVSPFDFVYCSMAFILTDGTSTYVTTAGHCVDDRLGVPGLGDRVTALGVPGTFGTVVYEWCEGADSLGNGCGIGADFAIIRVDDDKRAYVDPAMCHWGAPAGGLFTDRDTIVRTVQHFGWGIGIGDPGGVVGVPVGNPATQAREGLGVDFDEGGSTGGSSAIIYSAAISGDSGSGVLVADLDLDVFGAEPGAQALGVLTHITSLGHTYVQRLDVSLARASAESGRTFTLVTG